MFKTDKLRNFDVSIVRGYGGNYCKYQNPEPAESFLWGMGSSRSELSCFYYSGVLGARIALIRGHITECLVSHLK